ncbi:MAG TPA: hypothetical protein VGI48_06020 [Caldimonas sp.]|jgi:hypothetical protein
MKPDRSILDASFRYVPSVSTSVSDTWRRFGWRPVSVAERQPHPPLGSTPTLDLVSTRLQRAAQALEGVAASADGQR